jgi:predicted nucleotidyltransferase component of viral defense system
LDISDSEIVESIEQRTILPGFWSDQPDLVPFDVYPLEEIAAEKLRCVIQRVQCRDLYDIFRLAEDTHVSFRDVQPLFERKATAKGVDPATFAGRLEDRLPRYKGRWNDEMSDHLREPPRIDDVIRVVRRHLRDAGLLAT